MGRNSHPQQTVLTARGTLPGALLGWFSLDSNDKGMPPMKPGDQHLDLFLFNVKEKAIFALTN